MTHYSHVTDTVFQQIKSGRKIIEPRLNDDAHKRVRLGDLVVIISRVTKKEVVAKVVGVLRYSTFDELFAAFPPGHFGFESTVQAKQEVSGWYNSQDEAEHGVLGIKLHVLRQM